MELKRYGHKIIGYFKRLTRGEKILASVLTVSVFLNFVLVTSVPTEHEHEAASDSGPSPVSSFLAMVQSGSVEEFQSSFETLFQSDADRAEEQVLTELAVETEITSLEEVSSQDIKQRLEELKEQNKEAPDLVKTEIKSLKDVEEFAMQGTQKVEKPAVVLDRADILKDAEGRISSDFDVPELLYWRVAFWFDIYTKYGFLDRVVHHVDYPWIVFQVVDLSRFMDQSGPYWLRLSRGEKFLASEQRRIKNILSKLARLKNHDQLEGEEKRIFDIVQHIPLPVKQALRSSLNNIRSQTGQKEFIRKGVQVSGEYLPKMEEVFKNKGLPPELTRLPLTESSFNIYATSKVGASGIWQFMPGIGRKMMMVNHHIDERRSPIKATEAAARLLKENHLILWKKWPLALTAYNHGPGGVRRAVRARGTKDLSQIVGKYRSRSFGFASENFFSCFLAALHAEKYKEHLFDDLELRPAAAFKEFRLARATRPLGFLRKHKVSKESLYQYNPDIKAALHRNAHLPKGFRLLLPEAVLAKYQKEAAKKEL